MTKPPPTTSIRRPRRHACCQRGRRLLSPAWWISPRVRRPPGKRDLAHRHTDCQWVRWRPSRRLPTWSRSVLGRIAPAVAHTAQSKGGCLRAPIQGSPAVSCGQTSSAAEINPPALDSAIETVSPRAMSLSAIWLASGRRSSSIYAGTRVAAARPSSSALKVRSGDAINQRKPMSSKRSTLLASTCGCPHTTPSSLQMVRIS